MEQPQNLIQLLRDAANHYPEHGIIFGAPTNLTKLSVLPYPELLRRAAAKAVLLDRLRLKAGSIVLLHFKQHEDNLQWFWAVTYAGLVPAMSTPFSSNLQQRRRHILYLNDLLNQPLCLTRNDFLADFRAQNEMCVLPIEEMESPGTPDCTDVSLLANSSEESTTSAMPLNTNFSATDNQSALWSLPSSGYSSVHLESAGPRGRDKTGKDTAVLMLTSGSTGNAKAVCLTHAMILAAIAGKSVMNDTNISTNFFNWIGADHVACLIEIHLHAMSVGANQYHAQATDIVQSPLSFLEILHKRRIGYTFAPNFFLATLLRALGDAKRDGFLQALDLSGLKTFVSGGEANVVETGAALAALLAEHGAHPYCIQPAFGMTETCAGSTYSRLFPDHDLERGHEFASIGSCTQSMEMRIVDNDGNPVPAEASGSLEVRGTAVFSSYFRNDEATRSSFHDGWFVTGDQGMIDGAGQLNLTGRIKETLNINGIKYTPHEVEATLEGIPGARPSYSVVFPFRPSGSQTEHICVVYCPTYSAEDDEARHTTNDAISTAVMQQVGVYPLIIPLNEQMLPKTTLGKLSHTMIRKAFDAGELNSYRETNEAHAAAYRARMYEGPATDLEQSVLSTVADALEGLVDNIGVATNLFALGVNSIDLIRLKRKLQDKVGIEVPLITIINNPSARHLAHALQELHRPHEYNPVVVLQDHGSKRPLWLIHPGVGEVLVFLGLAAYIQDRPVYAMRARGFERGDAFFETIDEAVSTYHLKIKEIQPTGPYAIAGYSFGSMLAFEITKRLNSEGDEVKFLGVFNLPPHIKFRMRQLDWTNCLLHLAYFLGLLEEEQAHGMLQQLQSLPRSSALEHVISVASKERMEQLSIDSNSLMNWVHLAFALQSSAVDYEPSGIVDSVDVFYAIPLAAVAKDMDDWKANHLSKWAYFSRTAPKLRIVKGAHYTMLAPENITSFQKILRDAMAERGI